MQSTIACSTTWASGSCSPPDASSPGGAPATCCFRSEQVTRNDATIFFHRLPGNALEAGFRDSYIYLLRSTFRIVVQPAQGETALSWPAHAGFLNKLFLTQSFLERRFS